MIDYNQTPEFVEHLPSMVLEQYKREMHHYQEMKIGNKIDAVPC